MKVNQHGLSRASMNADIKRQVRQRDGFGCVVCGSAIFDYEHIDPDFANATEHTVAGITLLCPHHHSLKTRKLFSVQSVLEAMKKPAANTIGWSFHEMDSARTPPSIIMAGSTFTNVPIPILINGFPLIRIEKPEFSGGPYRISAKFYDLEGALTVEIIRNNCRIYKDNWDVTLIGGVLCVREKLRAIALELEFLPAFGINVKRCEMIFKSHVVKCQNNQLQIKTPSGGTTTLQTCTMNDCDFGIVYGNAKLLSSRSAANEWAY